MKSILSTVNIMSNSFSISCHVIRAVSWAIHLYDSFHLILDEVGSFLCLMCLNARYKSNEEHQNFDVFRDVVTAVRAGHHMSHLSY